MSKKYVPSFLKDTVAAPVQEPTTNTRSFNSTPALNTTNKFSALSEDYKGVKPVINTSLPAKLAPKLTPSTLASITSNGAVSAGITSTSSGPKKSFASKFAEQVKIANNPNYKPPPKPVNLTSEDDFPSLGGPKKATTATITVTITPCDKPATSNATNFADMAKGWAKQKEDEADAALQKAVQEETARHQAEIMRSLPIIGGLRRNQNNYNYEDEEEDYNPNYDESSLGGDSYQADDNGHPSSEEEEEEENEFNSNIGWDGRRRGDIY